MKKMRVLSIILAIVLMLTGCTTNKETGISNQGAKSDINSKYINLTMVKPNTINPLLNTDKSVAYITNLIYDGLFAIDENYDVVPKLVESYEVLQNGMSVNIKLKDATWHDGSDVTSEDVKFTIDLIRKNSSSPYNIFVENILSISTSGSKEFTIRFKNMYAFSIETLIFPIVSKAQIGSVTNKDISGYKKNLIGNGAYKIEKYEERGGMILSVNENYYDKLPENVRDIKVLTVPDEESQVSMVMALQSDIANVSLNDLSKFYEEQFKVTNYEGRDYEYVVFNYDNKFLKDINFRKAIAHAINKESIVEEGYISDATAINFPLHSKSKYYDSELKSLEYNKEKAKEYIKKVNPISDEKSSEYNKDILDKSTNISDKLQGNDNSTKEDIKTMISELDLKIIVNKSNSERVKSANIISENLKDIGIKATVNELTIEELDKSISDKDYDLALLGWELSSVPDVTDIIESSGYTDERLTNYMTSLTKATSKNQVNDIYKSIQKYVRDNVAFISLVIRDNYVVTSKILEGTIYPNDFDVYEGISNLNKK